jgi:hypothetical protein
MGSLTILREMSFLTMKKGGGGGGVKIPKIKIFFKAQKKYWVLKFLILKLSQMS